MIEHRLHHVKRPAAGTGDHNHHRDFINHDGIKVGFWHCDKGIGPKRYCPLDRDPWVRWAEKVMERQAAETARRRQRKPTTPTFGDPCKRGHASEHQRRNAAGSAFCLVCRREASRRSRMRRVADRIVTAALAA